jgi:hypothetical protein
MIVRFPTICRDHIPQDPVRFRPREDLLFVSEGYRRIDLRCARGGEAAGQERRGDQNAADQAERKPIGRTDFV